MCFVRLHTLMRIYVLRARLKNTRGLNIIFINNLTYPIFERCKVADGGKILLKFLDPGF